MSFQLILQSCNNFKDIGSSKTGPYSHNSVPPFFNCLCRLLTGSLPTTAAMTHRVLIAGHSLIRHLTASDLDPNFLLPIQATFHGISGAHIRDFHNDPIFLELLQHHHTLILQIGENDINSSTDNVYQSTHTIMNEVLHLLRLIRRCNPHLIIFWGQLLYRKRSRRRYSRIHNSRQQILFNLQIDTLNRYLKLSLPMFTSNTFYWRHVGATRHGLDWLHMDGTHLNTHGQYKLWRSIRGAIVSSLNRKYFIHLQLFQRPVLVVYGPPTIIFFSPLIRYSYIFPPKWYMDHSQTYNSCDSI